MNPRRLIHHSTNCQYSPPYQTNNCPTSDNGFRLLGNRGPYQYDKWDHKTRQYNGRIYNYIMHFQQNV